MAPDWEESAQNYDENPSRGLIDFVESTLNYNDNEKDCLLQVWIDFYKNDTVDYVRNCVALGIDGIIVNRENGKHVIIYNPKIIELTISKNPTFISKAVTIVVCVVAGDTSTLFIATVAESK